MHTQALLEAQIAKGKQLNQYEHTPAEGAPNTLTHAHTGVA